VGITNKFEGLARSDLPPLERVAYTVPEFCFRNNISRPTYHRLRAEGRGPVEMRLGLNAIRITADAERDWQRLMQQPRPDLEARTAERAVMAGGVAAQSPRHVSKRGRPHNSAPKHQKTSRKRQKAKAPAE
jgi:hypothetical protein